MTGKDRKGHSLARIIQSTLAIGLTTMFLAPAAHALEMKGWMVAGSGPGIMEGARYGFYNTDQRLFLEEKDRTGANLSWTHQINNYMMVKRITPGSGPIKCGETIAVFIEKEWIIYDNQTWSINVSTRTKLDPNNEAYKWQFTNCQAAGGVVPFNTPVGLFSNKAKDSLVGCKRVLGVNLCWAGDVGTFQGKNYRKADAAKILGPLAKLLPIPAPLLEGAKMVMSRGLDEEEAAPEKPIPTQEDLIADKLAEEEVVSRGVDFPTAHGN